MAEHGTEARYQRGCRCDECRRAHAAKRRDERARARAAARPVAASPLDPASVATSLAAALAELYPTPTTLEAYRIAHAVRLATVLDDRERPHLWRQASSSIRELLTDLAPADQSNGDAHADIIALIRGAAA